MKAAGLTNRAVPGPIADRAAAGEAGDDAGHGAARTLDLAGKIELAIGDRAPVALPGEFRQIPALERELRADASRRHQRSGSESDPVTEPPARSALAELQFGIAAAKASSRARHWRAKAHPRRRGGRHSARDRHRSRGSPAGRTRPSTTSPPPPSSAPSGCPSAMLRRIAEIGRIDIDRAAEPPASGRREKVRRCRWRCAPPIVASRNVSWPPLRQCRERPPA